MSVSLPQQLLDLLPWFLRPTKLGPKRSLVLGLSLGFSLSFSLTGIAYFVARRWRQHFLLVNTSSTAQKTIDLRYGEILDGVEDLIGHTPLIRIKSLSDMTGCDILGKCEFLNPFGSVKDRVSQKIIRTAEDAHLIAPRTGSCIFEGTSGSTGISIAGIARARGYKAHIVLSDDVAKEKVQLLEAFGAEVERVRPVSIVDKKHYVNLARSRAAEHGQGTILAPQSSSEPDFLVSSNASNPTRPSTSEARGLFADQFENTANMSAHYEGTAPEIWQQTSGLIDAFVSGAGTGGTIAGVGRYLKERKPDTLVVLSDPQGSGLFHKVHDGVMYANTEAEGTRRRHQVDTVVEGIGLNRLTKNFSEALPYIDDAISVTDEEAVAMSRHVAQQDGLFLGSSSAVNLVACVRLARRLEAESDVEGERKTIVTILCDSGTRHLSRFWNDNYLTEHSIRVSASLDGILG